jgi:hypothetical protein
MAELTEVERTVLTQHTFPAPSRSGGSICQPYPSQIPCSHPIFPALASGNLVAVVQKGWRMLEVCLSRTLLEGSKDERVGVQHSRALPLGGFEPRASSKASQMPSCGCSWQERLERVELKSRNRTVDVEHRLMPLT